MHAVTGKVSSTGTANASRCACDQGKLAPHVVIDGGHDEMRYLGITTRMSDREDEKGFTLDSYCRWYRFTRDGFQSTLVVIQLDI
jgi:hypothetical protein